MGFKTPIQGPKDREINIYQNILQKPKKNYSLHISCNTR